MLPIFSYKPRYNLINLPSGKTTMRLCSSLQKNIASFLLSDLQKKKGLNTVITRFMRDTPLAAIEIEMQLIAGFTSRACERFRSQQRFMISNPIRHESGLFSKIEESSMYFRCVSSACSAGASCIFDDLS